MDNDTRALLGELVRYAGDPEAFSAHRKKVLASYFSAQNPNRVAQLQDWQNLIEASRASAGTPFRAIGTLVDDLNDRCEALETLKEQIKRLKDAG
ncbi:MAG: DUF3135 domain-containing protein [Actinomycetota bacterium]